MAFVVEPLQYGFFVHGLVAALLVGSLCGLLGVYIVLRQMSYIGHGLSHAVFGGAVVSHVLGLNVYVGAGLWGFGAAVLIHRCGDWHRYDGQFCGRGGADESGAPLYPGF